MTQCTCMKREWLFLNDCSSASGFGDDFLETFVMKFGMFVVLWVVINALLPVLIAQCTRFVGRGQLLQGYCRTFDISLEDMKRLTFRRKPIAQLPGCCHFPHRLDIIPSVAICMQRIGRLSVHVDVQSLHFDFCGNTQFADLNVSSSFEIWCDPTFLRRMKIGIIHSRDQTIIENQHMICHSSCWKMYDNK